MVKTRVIKFLIDEDQYERIKVNASLRGHKTISAYLRDLALRHDLRFEAMLTEIHREVVRNAKAH